jgi:NADH-quinone oxidoreductase subunit K
VFILTLAAAEVAVGLGLVLHVYERFKAVDIDALSTMKG